MKTIHYLLITTTHNGTLPMKISACGKLIQRGNEFLRADLLVTNHAPDVTCGSCKRTGIKGVPS